MTTLAKTLFILAPVAFAAGLTGPGSEIWFGILKPIGALSFVTGYIVHVVSRLDPEQFAADQRLRDDLMRKPRTVQQAIELPAHVKAAA